MWALLAGGAAVPGMLVWDNEGAIGSWKSGRPTLTTPMQAFRGTLGIAVRLCRPADPEAKGLVERANGYLETSFLPGRRFSSPQDFNAQLAAWLKKKANARMHSTLRCSPADRIAEDRAAMMAPPPVQPDPAWRETKRLGRDHWVRIGTCDYSVHPRAIGRPVDIRMDLDEVVVTCAGEVVACYARSWAKHRTITDPDHERASII